MKIQVTMKDPDRLSDAIVDAVRAMQIEGLDEEELDAVRDRRADKVRELSRRWFKYGEYLSVEIDTEAETCTVLPSDRIG